MAQVGRPFFELPSDPALPKLTMIFRSKKRALQFWTEHKDVPENELEDLARKMSKELRKQFLESKEQVSQIDTPMAPKEIITTLRDLSKTTFPITQAEAIGLGSNLERIVPVGYKTSMRYQIHASRWDSHKISLPWGSVGRMVIDTVYSIAAMTHSKIIYLRTIYEYLYRYFGMSCKNKHVQELVVAAIVRWISCQVQADIIGEGANSHLFPLPTPLIGGGNLPLYLAHVDDTLPMLPLPEDCVFTPSNIYFVFLPDPIYDSLIASGTARKHITWFPPNYLRPFKDKCHEYDFAKFLAVRCHETQSSTQENPTLISWASIHAQMGYPGKLRPDRWLKDRQDQIKVIQDVWKDVSAKDLDEYLAIWRLPDHARFHRDWIPYSVNPELMDGVTNTVTTNVTM